MSKNMEIERKIYFDYMNQFLSISDTDTLLEKICQETPEIVNGKECSIFLIPDLVKGYNGLLTRGDGSEIHSDEMDEEFIILAKSTRVSNQGKIGRAFYCKGQGLTGWIFDKKEPLNLKDMQDDVELRSIDRDLKWTNEYGGAENHYSDSEKMPFIGVPMIKDGKALGVLRVSCTKSGESFSSFSTEVLTSFAGILSNLIENVTSRKHLENSLQGLIKIGSAREGVFKTIVKEIAHLVGANNCELYALDRYGEKIDIVATTGGYMQRLKEEGKSTSYKRGEGLTGWIFKTGKPLRINNIHDFSDPKRLNDNDLIEISNGPDINKEDRIIKWLDLDKQYKHHPVPHPYFLGVPIKSEAGEVIGVLRVSSPRAKIFFRKQDMYLLMDFAKDISLIFKNERQSELYNILIEIGNIHDRDKLFRYVVEEIPTLVLGYGCSIFFKPPNKDKIELAYTSSAAIKRHAKANNISYEYGQGKTGFVAGMGRALMMNYYGSGELQRIKMENDFSEYSKNPKYLCCRFISENDEPVGIIRVIRCKNESAFTEKEKEMFNEFCKNQRTRKDGGLGTYQDICETYESDRNKHALSFLALPIKISNKKEDLIGVIRIPRTSEGVRFTDDDLALIESITGRLVSVIEIEKTTSKIKEHLETLSLINNTINSSSERDEILDEILKVLTDNDYLGYEFAAIQLVNRANDTIDTIKCRYNPSIADAVDPFQWKKSASHPLNPDGAAIRDIHAYVLMEEKNAIVVKQKDERYYKYLDREIFEKYDHINLVRAFAPIIDNDPKGGIPIGTIEAGHHITRKQDIELQELEMLKAVANQVAITIRNWEQKEKLTLFKDKAIFRNLSSMGSAISHKIYNSVGLIRLKAGDLIEAIDRDDYDHKKYRSQIEVIKKKCEEALLLPQHFSELLSRIDSINKTEVDVCDLIGNEIIPYSSILKRDMQIDDKIRIEFETRKPNIPVFADRALLTETFNELIQNSIKAMIKKGGKISIECVVDSGTVKIYFNDEGEGIPEKHHEDIFQPGFSLRKGLGHGLWMCKNIINEIHRGKLVLVDSKKDKGTKILVELPIYYKELQPYGIKIF